MRKNRGPEDNSRNVRSDAPPSGTTAGADVTRRMSGVPDHDNRDDRPHEDRLQDDRLQEDRVRDEHVETVRPTDRPHGVKPAKTSAAAVFGLVFGLAALFSALTAILSPAAILFGILGILISVIGLKMAKRPGVTGRGVAIGGLVTAILGLLLGAAVLVGAAVVVNDEQRLNQLENWIEDVRDDLPTTEQIQNEIPG